MGNPKGYESDHCICLLLTYWRNPVVETWLIWSDWWRGKLDAQIDGDDICLCNNFLYHSCFCIIVCKGSRWSIFIHAATGHALNMRSFHPVQLVLSPITISSRRRMAVEEVSMRKLQETLGTTSLQCIHASHLALYFFGNRERPWFCAIWVVPA